MRPTTKLWALTLPLIGVALACGDSESTCTNCTTGASTGGGGEGGITSLVCPQSGVVAGPWAHRVTQSSAVVRWDGCVSDVPTLSVTPEAGGAATNHSGQATPSEVTLSFTGFAGVPPDLPGTYYLNEVSLDGLTPGTCYSYSLDAEPLRVGRFCTARPPGAAFTFMAIGDTNPAISRCEEIVDQALATQPDFSLHLGDIQYYTSVLDSWSQWFLSMQPLLSGGAFFPSIGNHESEAPTEYQDYYGRLFAQAGFNGNNRYYQFENGGIHFFGLDTESDFAPNSEQGIWLTQQLQIASGSTGYRGSVLFMHRTLITVGDAGSEPALRALWEPVFSANAVVLVLQGHMHGYERFVTPALTYVTSAGGGGLLGNVNENVQSRPEEAAMRVASGGTHHAMVFDVTPTSIEGRALDADGQAIDSFSVPLPAPL